MAFMSVYMNIHISICTHVHMPMRTHVWDEYKGYMPKCACLHTNGSIYNTICLCVCMYVYMCGSVYLNTCNNLMMLAC